MRALLLVLAAVACSSHETVVAKLEETTVQVDKMPHEREAWHTAKVGDTFVIGSAVRTGPKSHARLKLGRTGRLDVDADAIVRFTRKGSSKHNDVYVETGNVEIESGEETLGLVGEVVLEPNGHAVVARDKAGGVTINVTVGNVVLEDNAGPVTVAAGNSITIPQGGKPTVGKAASKESGFTVKVSGAPAHSGETTLSPGEHRLAVGAQLQVPEGSTVAIGSDDARIVTTGPSALRTGGSPGALTTASAGAITLTAATSDAMVDVPGGSIVARSGDSAATAQLDAAGTHVEAQKGETLIRTATGERRLAAGETAVLEPNGTIDVMEKAPAHAKVAIAAGESPVLHDPKAPTPVRIAFGCGAAVVELAKDRSFKKVVSKSRGTGGANVLVPAGSFVYRVRCETGKSPGGSLRVVRDSGRAPLPKAAARTTVEADGREYTILYENRLPEVDLVWKNAPASGQFGFVLEPKLGPPKRITNSAPRFTFHSGELAEGSYRFWVENQTTHARSQVTTIVIDFNNAAASASIEAADVTNGKVLIRGSVIEGSTVSVGGAAVELDRHRRFNTEAAPQAGDLGVGIRIAHPKAGVHYYVVSTGPS